MVVIALIAASFDGRVIKKLVLGLYIHLTKGCNRITNFTETQPILG